MLDDQEQSQNLTDLEPFLDIKALYEYALEPDLPYGFYILSAIWLSITLFIGFVANGACIVSFFKNSDVSCYIKIVEKCLKRGKLFQLRTPFNLILMNLVSSDFVMMTFGIPPDIVASSSFGWKLGYHTCVMNGFLMTLTGKKLSVF